MKIQLILFSLIVFTCLGSCNNCNNNQKQNNIKEINDNIDILNTKKENSNYESAYDSIENMKIDTTTLIGKRKKIINNFILKNGLSEPEYDTLIDLNYDEIKDYILGYYGKSGTGIKNGIEVYLFNEKLNAYVFNEQLSKIRNPSFYIKEKTITGFYIGSGGGSGEKLEWINNKWVVTKEFEVDFTYEEREKTKWKIKYPLRNKKETIILPYQMIPPKEILQTKIEW